MQTQVNGTASAAPKSNHLVLDVPLKLVDELERPARTNFGDIKELADDIKAHGQLQAALLRPKGKRYEVVIGGRRTRALRLNNADTILAVVRDLTDAEVIEIQLVENAKRLDLHPVEEADTYRVLINAHGYRVEDIAAKVGKSLAHVYQRLKLCELIPEARKAFLEEKLSPATAILVARIPDAKLQKQALKDIIEPKWNGEPLGARAAADLVQERFMLRLVDAPFDRGDAKLVPAAGSCSDCPKRTGNQKELFGDVKSADTCTDPTCFADKRNAHWKKLSVAAVDNGQRVLSDKESKKLFPYGRQLVTGSDYIDLGAQNYEDPKMRTWRAILGKDAPLPVLARDEHGDVHELVPRAEVTKSLKDAGKPVAGASKSTHNMSDSEKKRRDKALVEGEVTRRAIADVVEKTATGVSWKGAPFWMVLVRGMIRAAWNDVAVAVAKRRELEVPKGKRAEDVLLSAVKQMTGPELRGLALEIVAMRGVNGGQETFKEVCAHFKVITARHEKAVRAERSAPKAKPAKSAKAKSK